MLYSLAVFALSLSGTCFFFLHLCTLVCSRIKLINFNTPPSFISGRATTQFLQQDEVRFEEDFADLEIGEVSLTFLNDDETSRLRKSASASPNLFSEEDGFDFPTVTDTQII